MSQMGTRTAGFIFVYTYFYFLYAFGDEQAYFMMYFVNNTFICVPLFYALYLFHPLISSRIFKRRQLFPFPSIKRVDKSND